MPMTDTLQSTYDALKAMDKTLSDAEAHLRVVKAMGSPEAVKLEAALQRAKTQRQDMMKAIEQEANRG